MAEYDAVNHPKHYTQYNHEVIELTEAFDFCIGNAIKYVLRAPFKGNTKQDLEKALWYVRREQANFDEDNYGKVCKYFSDVSPTVKAIVEGDLRQAEKLLTEAIHKAEIKQLKDRVEQLEKEKHQRQLLSEDEIYRNMEAMSRWLR